MNKFWCLAAVVTGLVLSGFSDDSAAYMITSHKPDSISIIDEDGNILRQITEIKHPQEAHILPDGRIFSSEIPGAVMLSPEGEVLWRYDVPKGAQNPVAQVLGEDRFLVGNEGPCRLLEINSKGEVLKTIQLSSSVQASHGQFRFCRKTPQGTYLVPFTKEGAVREYDGDGNVVHDFGAFNTPVSAIRLKNGNTLIGLRATLVELNAQGEKVWEIDLKTKVGYKGAVTGIVRLDNGNTLFAAYNASTEKPDLYEVSPKGTVVRSITIPSLDKVAAVRLVLQSE